MSDSEKTFDAAEAQSAPETESSLAETMPGRTSPVAKPANRDANETDRADRRLAMAQTLPHGGRAYSRADTQPAATEPAPTEPAVTYENDDVITSTPVVSSGRADACSTAGISESPPMSMVSESEARTILNARFAAAGVMLHSDYPFQQADLAVTLDGYDPDKRIGFSYLSHNDADVVTDFDEATELAFQQLAAEASSWVLVIHDTDTPSVDALERRIDAFFVELNRPG